MRTRLLVAFLSVLTLTAQDSTTADDWRRWLNRGVEAYKSARFQDAVEYFQKSVDLSPNEVSPHLYLATELMSQYIWGNLSPENLDLQHRAVTEFNRALQLDANNLSALQSLASVNYQQAQHIQDDEEKLRKLDETVPLFRRVLAVDPRNKEAYYLLAVIDWTKADDDLFAARV